MSNRIPTTPRHQSQSETDTETSSRVSLSSSEQSSTSEDDSEKAAQVPVMKTRQTSDTSPTTPATNNTNSSAPPQAAINSSPPTVKNRQTGDQKRARYGQASNLPAYQRHAHINKIKTVEKPDTADIQQVTASESRWEQFSKAVTPEGKLFLKILSESDVSEVVAWLHTSPAALRELALSSFCMDSVVGALSGALRNNTTLTKLNLQNNWIGDQGTAMLACALEFNTTLTTLDFRKNNFGQMGVFALANALKLNKALDTLDLRNNTICEKGAEFLANALKVNKTLTTLHLDYCWLTSDVVALAEALQVNISLTTLGLSGNQISAEGAIALAEALNVNTTLTTLDLRYNPIGAEGIAALVEVLRGNKTLTDLKLDLNVGIDPKLKQEIGDLLERNRRLKFQPYAEASLDLIFKHSPVLREVGMPTDVIPVLAQQLSTEVLAVLEQEWGNAFRAPPPPITTTTTNATVTTTTTTTTDATIPTTLVTPPAALATDSASSPPSMTQPTATAAEINALLADPNPVVALSRWIDGHANPVAALNWVDPSNGYTLLHYAVEAQQGAVVRSLLARGIDRTRADQTNQTAAQLAQQRADSSSSSAVAAIAALFK